MNNVDMKLLRSAKAIVCKKHHAGEMGGAFEWFVCLADGFLMSCGAEPLSEARAHVLAETLNTLAPNNFARENLERWSNCGQ